MSKEVLQVAPARISCIIPTLNAEGQIGPLVRNLLGQTMAPDELLVIDSSSEDATVVEARAAGARVEVIDRADFDHGATRHLGATRTEGDFILFLTQDAVPAAPTYVEALLAPFEDEQVAAVTGRQLPKADARRFEQLVRGFNYPAESFTRSYEDAQTMGIKAFFASDVCAAYRRSAYEAVGGFPRPCATNEDMLMAARLMSAGYRTAYAAEAEVYHSHNLTPREQYRRNYAVGASLEGAKDELAGVSEVGEGVRLVKAVSLRLLRELRLGELAAFGVDCAARLAGNRAGRRAQAAAEREILRGGAALSVDLLYLSCPACPCFDAPALGLAA